MGMFLTLLILVHRYYRFLCIRDSKISRTSAFSNMTQSDPSVSQIEAMCSGQFSNDWKQPSFSNILKSAGLDETTQGSSSDVIGLCSGVFPVISPSASKSDNEDIMPKLHRKKRYSKANK